MTNPFAYRESANPLARLAAGPKTIFLLCTAAAAMSFGPFTLVALLGLGFFLHFVVRIPFRDSLGPLSVVLLLAAFAALLRGFFPGDGRVFAGESLLPSAIYAARLVTAFLFARLFYVSTRISELGDSLTSALRWLRPPRRKREASLLSDPGMLATLTLLFLPRLFEDLGRTGEAAAARGYGMRRGRWGAQAAVAYAFVFGALKRGLRAAAAMEARAYSPTRTLMSQRWRMSDWLTLAAGPLLLVAGLCAGV